MVFADKMDELCRLCAEHKTNKINIFNPPNSRICEIIEEVLQIKISPDETLPQEVCKDCVRNLYTFQSFFQKCHEAQEALTEKQTESKYVVVHVDIQRDDEFNANDWIKSEPDFDDCSSSNSIKTDIEIPNLEVEELHETNKKFQKARSIREFSRSLLCSLCPVIERSPKLLEEHLQKVHNTSPIFKCNYCSKQFGKYRSFSRHVALHVDGCRYKCELCSKTFGQKVALQNHFQTHNAGSFYKCDYCEKEFRHTSSLYKHLHKHSNAIINCNDCGAKLASLETLRNHVKAYHTKVKNEVCNFCDKRFATKPALYYHLKCHKKKD